MWFWVGLLPSAVVEIMNNNITGRIQKLAGGFHHFKGQNILWDIKFHPVISMVFLRFKAQLQTLQMVSFKRDIYFELNILSKTKPVIQDLFQQLILCAKKFNFIW